MWDKSGNKYLDASSGAIVANIGHGVDAVREAVNDQMNEAAFAHTSQFVSEAGLHLAERLVRLSGLQEGRVYFTSGGSESVETALKMARAYFVEKGEHSRKLCIGRLPSYHGSSFGALSVTGHPARRRPYLPLLDSSLTFNRGQWQFANTPYPYRCRCGAKGVCASDACGKAYAAELETLIAENGAENVMAFIGEPVVGASMGALPPHESYWREVRSILDKHGVLLIADEVMTGLGRVGEKMGLDLWGIKADIIALGKGLSAGYLPLGAVVASSAIVKAFEDGSGVFEHGFTYSGHPVACAAGVAVLDYVERNRLIEAVAKKESRFFQGFRNLSAYEIVGDIRGRGFLAGIELVANRTTKEPFPADVRISQVLAREALAFGLMVYPGGGFLPDGKGDHIMIAPPFTIADDELEEMFKRLNMALGSVSQTLMTIG